MYKTERELTHTIYRLADGYDTEEQMLDYLIKEVDSQINAGPRSIKIKDLPNFKPLTIVAYLSADTGKGWTKLYLMDITGDVYSSGSNALQNSFQRIIDQNTLFTLTNSFKVQVEHRLNKSGDRTYDLLTFLG